MPTIEQSSPGGIISGSSNAPWESVSRKGAVCGYLVGNGVRILRREKVVGMDLDRTDRAGQAREKGSFRNAVDGPGDAASEIADVDGAGLEHVPGLVYGSQRIVRFDPLGKDVQAGGLFGDLNRHELNRSSRAGPDHAVLLPR